MTFIDSSAPREDDIMQFEDDGNPAPPEAEDNPEGPYDAEARAMGWHPLAEFRGDPDRWVDAETFVKRAHASVPLMRENLKRLTNHLTRSDKEIAGLKDTVAEQVQAIKDLTRLARTANQAGYDRALRELEAERREAVRSGDEEAFEQVEERIHALREAREPAEEPAPPAAPEPPKPQLPPEIVDFIDENPWFNTDPDLQRAMTGAHQAVMARHPTKPLLEQLELARARVVADWPEKFPDEADMPEEPPAPPAPRAPARRPGTPPPPRGARPVPRDDSRDPFTQIADEGERAMARKEYARIRNHDPDMTAGEFVHLYNNPHDDIFAVQKRYRKRA